MTTLICTILALFGGWNLRKQAEPKQYHANEALALFTQWQMKADSDITWWEDGEGFETFCAAVDLYLYTEGIHA